MQVMIRVLEARKIEHGCNLLAEINKKGEVTNLYDYNGNELKLISYAMRFITIRFGGRSLKIENF